jgi:hypothetical protein
VPESELAWHAGISFWRGTNRINDTSVGIELENRGWQTSGVKRFTPFEPAQIAALVPLAKDIIARYNIRPETWWPIRTSPRSAKTIPARCSRGGAGAAGDRRMARSRARGVYINGGHAFRRWSRSVARFAGALRL